MNKTSIAIGVGSTIGGLELAKPVRLGVSVVICCHNSAQLLPQTLSHLAAQELTDVVWEVIVIDNASTDETARVARESWPPGNPAPMRVINEPQLGLSYARWCGFKEARYEFVCFVDDDNWVCPGWVRTVSEVMTTHPEVGAWRRVLLEGRGKN